MEPCCWCWWTVLSGCFLLCLPGIAGSSRPTARVDSVGATWIALRLQAGSAPVDDPSGLGVVSYTVRFTSDSQDSATEFELKRYAGEDETLMTIEELQPRQVYHFRVTPRLADGSEGPDIEFVQRTADYERPDAVTITSSRVGLHADRYTLTWNAPFYSGGHQVRGYRVQYAQAAEVNTAVEPWQAGSVSSQVTSVSVGGRHSSRVTLQGLQPHTFYALTVRAVLEPAGSQGEEEAPGDSAFLFRTAGDTAGGSGERAGVLLVILTALVSCHLQLLVATLP